MNEYKSGESAWHKRCEALYKLNYQRKKIESDWKHSDMQCNLKLWYKENSGNDSKKAKTIESKIYKVF